MKYQIKRLENKLQNRLIWDINEWRHVPPLSLDYAMGKTPLHHPRVEAKMAYNSKALFAIFRVQDRFVRATTTANQGPVYQDSCVEFFFTPESEKRQRYFNFEVNCSGKALFHYQSQPRNGVAVSESSLDKIHVLSTLPSIVEPEYSSPLTWLIAWRMPFETLKEYPNFTPPQAGSIWHANFYKCADKSSYPHWLTWVRIDNPKPDFHRPDCFGELIFE